MSTASFVRTADPYRDTAVIDVRAPRTNQAIVGSLSLVAVLTGWWPVFALLALQLAVGLAFGRRYCVPCLLYFEVIQPRIGEGRLEDARPPRFANVIGLVFLGAASVAYAAGAAAIGAALGALVAALALLAAATGLCVGCEMYRIGARLRGIRARGLARFDVGDVGELAEGTIVEFTHPLCSDCVELRERLERAGETVRTVDVSVREDLARKYGVAVVPTAVRLAADGRVLARIA
ncbi:MAG TPA: DUF4395 family protein [Candidatus Limnocylindria bacterium]|nr:DUF4395 family protein [Candidatus Limnocylindria bacterium]